VPENNEQQQAGIIHRAEGVTPAERYLKWLCERTFLSLWSYPAVYRDQGQSRSGGDGKEVCDLLVVFENHIIIFSDKDCTFPNTGNLVQDWSRWFRAAVLKSAQQVWGAERWIRSYPDRLFTDRRCQHSFPLDLPDLDRAVFHRIVVAHDSSDRCREELGGSGSLLLVPRITGSMHYTGGTSSITPLAIGEIDPLKGFVHVLDDTTLGILLGTLDTVTDFVDYLTKKERLITGGRLIAAAGEEELLAYYLKWTNDQEKHDFILPAGITAIALDEGGWEAFARNPQRLAQLEADKISYAWDGLIEAFNKHILAGTQHFTNTSTTAQRDQVMRFLAREPRLRRRMLASTARSEYLGSILGDTAGKSYGETPEKYQTRCTRTLLEAMQTTPRSHRRTLVSLPASPGDPYYVFLLVAHPEDIEYENYRVGRRNLLEACCLVTKLRFPAALDIVGIATEPMSNLDALSSEDAMYFDCLGYFAHPRQY
jgi:hypothetical protein